MSNHEEASAYLFPIHGHHKLLAEGYRTRDGHVIEWLSRLARDPKSIKVLSRPEPILRRPFMRVDRATQDEVDADFVDTWTWRLPTSRDKSRWWVDSLSAYPRAFKRSLPGSVIVWNPMLGIAPWWPQLAKSRNGVHLDLLDDWTVHYAFRGLRNEIERSYTNMFRDAKTVTANSEETLALAHRFGRSDALLLTNGVDPERFRPERTDDLHTTVGYVGKLGTRIDVDLILQTAELNPDIRFVFAGPVLDGDFDKRVRPHENVIWLGDVHYRDVPDLLTTFDLGWIPHRVGEGEVGGDVIKTYEYRAASLPVLTTPIIGIHNRGFSNVTVLDGPRHAAWIREAFEDGAIPARGMQQFDEAVTWRSKASSIAALAQVPL